jgi:hypothetical protein
VTLYDTEIHLGLYQLRNTNGAEYLIAARDDFCLLRIGKGGNFAAADTTAAMRSGVP